jgi:hypothetical protein
LPDSINAEVLRSAQNDSREAFPCSPCSPALPAAPKPSQCGEKLGLNPCAAVAIGGLLSPSNYEALIVTVWRRGWDSNLPTPFFLRKLLKSRTDSTAQTAQMA